MFKWLNAEMNLLNVDACYMEATKQAPHAREDVGSLLISVPSLARNQRTACHLSSTQKPFKRGVGTWNSSGAQSYTREKCLRIMCYSGTRSYAEDSST
jgi:hypothetical protein